MRIIEQHEMRQVAGGLTDYLYDDNAPIDTYDGGGWSFNWESGFDSGFDSGYISNWSTNVAGTPEMQGGYCSPQNPLGMLVGEQNFVNDGVHTAVSTTYDPNTGLTLVSTSADSESGSIMVQSWYDRSGTLGLSTVEYMDGEVMHIYAVDPSGHVIDARAQPAPSGGGAHGGNPIDYNDPQ